MHLQGILALQAMYSDDAAGVATCQPARGLCAFAVEAPLELMAVGACAGTAIKARSCCRACSLGLNCGPKKKAVYPGRMGGHAEAGAVQKAHSYHAALDCGCASKHSRSSLFREGLLGRSSLSCPACERAWYGQNQT